VGTLVRRARIGGLGRLPRTALSHPAFADAGQLSCVAWPEVWPAVICSASDGGADHASGCAAWP